MICQYCNHQNPDDQKTCMSCGKPIPYKLTGINIQKFKNTLRNTGYSVILVGWLNIITNVGFYIWSILDKNYVNLGLPKIDTSGATAIIMVSIIFIILGRRIASLVDKNVRTYLIILFVLFIGLSFLAFSNGGFIGIIYIIALVNLIFSLFSINKALKVEEFTASLIKPEYELGTKGWIAFVIVALGLIAGAFYVDVYRMRTFQYLGYSKEVVIKISVDKLKSKMVLPSKLDEVTDIVDIKAEPDAVRYEYLWTGNVDKSKISDAVLKNFLIPKICSNPETKKLLDLDINMEYSYSVANSTDTYFVLLTKTDCVK